MIRRLLERLIAWFRKPLYDVDDPLQEYWSRKHSGER